LGSFGDGQTIVSASRWPRNTVAGVGSSGGLAGTIFKNIQNRVKKPFSQSFVLLVRETAKRTQHYLPHCCGKGHHMLFFS
jgi:hypothetical protein